MAALESAIGAKAGKPTGSDRACFMPKGYCTLTLSRQGTAIPLDTVKGLLEKTVAAR